jgi:hypothetical protein
MRVIMSKNKIMNKDRFSQIIDEVYENYTTKYMGHEDVPSKDLFLFEIKTNKEFSEKWGLKIEERELSLEERCDEYIKINPQITNDVVLNYKWIGDNLCTHEDYNKWNIPTRLTTLTYNNEKIEIHE